MKKKFVAGLVAAGLTAAVFAAPAETRCESIVCPPPVTKHIKKGTKSKTAFVARKRTVKADRARTRIVAVSRPVAAKALASNPSDIDAVRYTFNTPLRRQPAIAGRAKPALAARVQNVRFSGPSVVAMIESMAPQYGVPTWFALRIAKVESGYNPNARGRAGELGVFQLKCATARSIGYRGSCNGLLHARTGVQYGLKHLSIALKSSRGNLKLAASKHNGGLGRKSLVPKYVEQIF